jgi:hypothetical protein
MNLLHWNKKKIQLKTRKVKKNNIMLIKQTTTFCEAISYGKQRVLETNYKSVHRFMCIFLLVKSRILQQQPEPREKKVKKPNGKVQKMNQPIKQTQYLPAFQRKVQI